MSRGRYLSLEEARKAGKLDQFAKEHPSVGDGALFNALSDAMITGRKGSPQKRKDADASRKKPSGGGTSSRDRSED